MLMASVAVYGQCPSSGTITSNETVGTCTHSGNLTVKNAATLTVSSDMTITGNLVLGENSGSSSATITVNTGQTLTINGDITAGYHAGVILINGGGTVNVDGRFYSDVRASTSFTFSNVTVTLNNVSTTQSKNDYQSNLNLINGADVTIAQGGYHNEDQSTLTIRNSSLNLTTGDFFNDDKSTTIVREDGYINVNNGNFLTENESSLTIGIGTEPGTVYVNGNFNNDFRAAVTVNENGSLNVTGDFNNGVNPSGSTANEGNLIINGGSLDVGNDLNNRYGSDIQLSDGGTISVVNDVVNEQASTIDINDGTFSYGGNLDDHPSSGGVNSPSGDVSCDDGCCGGGCAALPVTLLSFDIKPELDHVLLRWTTATELNNDHFNIHRSTNGVDFEIIDWVSGNGTTDEQKNYELNDYPSQKGIYYYQLEQVDYDGKNEFFPVKKVNYHLSTEKLKVYPVPVNFGEAFFIDIPGNRDEAFTVKLFDVTGGADYNLFFTTQEGVIRLEPSSLELSTGVYILQVTVGSRQYLERISVQ